MSREKKILILITIDHYRFFAKKIDAYLCFDAILSCFPLVYDTQGYRGEIIRGFSHWNRYIKGNKDYKLKIFVLDYVPIPIFMALNQANKKHASNIEINFIQHGIFEAKDKTQFFPIKTLNWFLMTFYFVYYFVFRDKRILDNINVVKEYAKKGGDRAIFSLIKEYPPISNCFFWDQTSLEYFDKYESFGQIFKNKYVVGSPDQVMFKYSNNNTVVVITQPLFKTGHCSTFEYQKMLYNINKLYEEKLKKVLFILHPKIDKDFVKKKKCFYLDELPPVIETEKIIGHFSSLLLKIPKDIEIEQWDNGIENIKRANDMFKKKYLDSERKQDDQTDFYNFILSRI